MSHHHVDSLNNPYGVGVLQFPPGFNSGGIGLGQTTVNPLRHIAERIEALSYKDMMTLAVVLRDVIEGEIEDDAEGGGQHDCARVLGKMAAEVLRGSSCP